ncbi:MAG: molybdopterin-dependent oxidoreductase, partial [Bacillota bacterium]
MAVLRESISNNNTGIINKSISRRSFFKVSAALGGTLTLAGCGGSGLKRVATEDYVDEGIQVIPTSGTNNCGGRCVIKAHVKDGVILRLSTDERPMVPGGPQVRACVRGRGYRKTYLHPDRLKYPMKRVGKRGEGKFERISWGEATDIMASEIQRIGRQYGPGSRYINYAWGYNANIHPMYIAERLLNLDGGHLKLYNDYSTAATNAATPYTYGTGMTGSSQEDWLNSKLIVLWGFNPAETIFGSLTMYYLRKAKDKGAKIIVVDPRYSDTAIALADEWIPLLPTTDNAVMDAMAYVMITENLHDQAFLDKYCLGFDEEHMPEGYPTGESYKSYVLGKKDGIPKTPEWAANISKVPAEKIIQLARDYASIKPAALIQGWGPQRHAYGEQPVRGATILASMTGNVGISGGWASGSGYYGRQNVPIFPTLENPYPGQIPCFLWTEAVV